jgi:phosphoribosylanthranilate isomerase
MQALYIGPKGAPQNKSVIKKTLEYESYVDYFLLDTQVDGASGVTGITHDWTVSTQIVNTCSKPVILAGGLSSINVIAAIEKVHPWGVDAFTQLDLHPGKKDLSKVRIFIETIRAWEKRIQ